MTTNGDDTYVLCEVAEASYALRSRDILHIQMLEHVTPVPNSAPFLEGIIFSRGEVVSAIDLRKRFGLEEAPRTERTRVIVTKSNNRRVGLIVDSAREFRRIPAASIQPIDEAVVGVDRHFLHGITEVDKRLVLLFDLDRILDLSDLPDENAAASLLKAEPSPAS